MKFEGIAGGSRGLLRRGALVAAIWLTLPAFGQEFTYSRPIQTAGTGPQRLAVDLELLARCRRDLADLRLRDEKGRDVPYVLLWPKPEKAPWMPGLIRPIPETKHSSGFEADFGKVMPMSRLRVEGLATPFLKRFHLEGSGDRVRWTELVREGSLFDLPGEGLQRLGVDFQKGEYRYLRMVWDDRSSARSGLPRQARAQLESAGNRLPKAELPWFYAPAKASSSAFVLSLPGPELPLCSVLLELPGSGPLLREATIGERAGGGLRTLGSAQLKRVESQGAAASRLRIPMDSPKGRELLLTIENGDNPPLSPSSILVEYEAQPWIFFVSPGQGEISARFGNAKVDPPRFDLAALQEQLNPERLPEARWRPVNAGLEPNTAGQAPAPDPALLPGPVLSPQDFATRRKLPEALPGLSALVLDAHVLAQSPGMGDLRLLNASGQQIPYILERRPEPLEMELPLSRIGFHQGVSTYRISLPQSGLRQARLLLEADNAVFRRELSLTEEGGESARRLLARSTWIQTESALRPEPLSMELWGLRERHLLLSVEEGDNAALPLKKAKLQLPCWRLRFHHPGLTHPGQALTLCYGNPGLREPHYDLSLVASEIISRRAVELNLAPMEPPAEKWKLNTWIFWGALLAAVAALVFVLIRMLKGGEDKPEERTR